MAVFDADWKDPPHFLFPSMTVTEDRILREVYRSGGEMNSDTLRAKFAPSECVDNVYGGLCALREMGYVETEIVDWNDWRHHYRPMKVSLTLQGRRHVQRTYPVTDRCRGALLWTALAGGVVAAAQSVYKEPDFGPIGLSILAASVILLLARRAGMFLNRKK